MVPWLDFRKRAISGLDGPQAIDGSEQSQTVTIRQAAGILGLRTGLNVAVDTGEVPNRAWGTGNVLRRHAHP